MEKLSIKILYLLELMDKFDGYPCDLPTHKSLAAGCDIAWCCATEGCYGRWLNKSAANAQGKPELRCPSISAQQFHVR